MASPEMVGGNGRQARKRPPASKRKTAEFRRWTTVNITDARTDIEDTELFWAENAIPIGKGQMQTLNGPGASIATLAQGISSLWGFTLNGSPVTLVVGQDGSLTQVTVPGGVQTVIGGAGTVSPNAHLTPWQGSTVLIIDPLFGFSSWDGTIYVVIDATRVGESLAVFEGRAWLGHNRTITFTAPGTFNDFTIGNGAGTVILTDEAFIGNITLMVSAFEQLWIIGPAAIESLANVTASGVAPSVLTTFSLTNVLGGVGSVAPSSTSVYYRAITFMSPEGSIFAISGVTPQELSEKISQLGPGLTLTPDVPAAVASILSLKCLLFLVTYTQANVPNLPTPANGLSTATPLVIGFTKGKTFFVSQGATLTWITTVIVNGVAQAWGADGAGHIFQLFGAANDAATPYKIVGKLSSLSGKAVQMKAVMKIGVELQAAHPVAPTLTLDSDLGAKAFPLAPGVALKLQNNTAQILLLQNAANQTLVLRGQGIALPKQDAAMFGHYIGWTYQGNDPPHRLQAIQFEYVDTRDWNP